MPNQHLPLLAPATASPPPAAAGPTLGTTTGFHLRQKHVLRHHRQLAPRLCQLSGECLCLQPDQRLLIAALEGLLGDWIESILHQQLEPQLLGGRGWREGQRKFIWVGRQMRAPQQNACLVIGSRPYSTAAGAAAACGGRGWDRVERQVGEKRASVQAA